MKKTVHVISKNLFHNLKKKLIAKTDEHTTFKIPFSFPKVLKINNWTSNNSKIGETNNCPNIIRALVHESLY